MINFKKIKQYSELTYNEKINSNNKIKLIWKKTNSEDKNDKIFDWVIDTIMDNNAESYFKRFEKRNDSNTIKCFEEKIVANVLERGLEKLAVLLPQNTYKKLSENILLSKRIGKVEYFHSEEYAKSWIELT